MKTNKELQRETRGGLPFTVPKGSPVQVAAKGPMDKTVPYWVRPEIFDRNSIEWHDAEYYGVTVMPEDVEE